MGANHSSTHPESHGSAPKKPIITAFHSSMNWRIHFDASKQTNQLLIEMGANHSSTHPESHGSAPKKPIITAFHSSMNWRIHFDASKQTNQLMVIDFTATWCGPCKYMEPIVHDFAAQYSDVEFVKINVDELGDVAQDFGVESMPTFVLVKKGKVVAKVIGADKEELQKKIQKHRY